VVLAVVELHSRAATEVDERVMRSLTYIGHQLGAFLVRRRGELVTRSVTQRELEVLQLASQGMSTKAIAEALTVSPATVKTHLERLYAKLGVSDRAAAVALGIREGLIR
jgi:two-component system nitrate/nitrite response regulator NarL